MKLTYIPKSGNYAGKVHEPHLYEDGYYVVSETRFVRDYVKVKTLNEVFECYKKGFKVRMSYLGINPSLISPASIKVI
ncbi:hypothetical protein [Tatumella ptyseos]|uniref:Uncharacterized protein n=1 Tax=Tatumella ptyseos TaxID=82987 RepID=A0A2X5PCK1_9GAMM|nr:hypothetical protein [Tatumella ptyseos]SQK74492.1 Uncharacterised protein [Tatumella ptyseos]